MSKKSRDPSFIGKIISSSVERTLIRLTSIPDEVVRYTLLLELLRTTLDNIFNIALEFSEEEFESERIMNMIEHEGLEQFDGNVQKRFDAEKRKLEIEKSNRDSQMTIDKLRHVIQLLDCEFDKLMDWIRQPIYAPDHPNGRRMMKESKEEFMNLSG